MDQAVEFIEGDWDPRYELSTMHLSYLLQTLFPLHTIKWETTKKHYENIKSKLAESGIDIDGVIDIIVTGSMAEGYSIPPSIDRKRSAGAPPDVEVLSDVDTLWVSSQLNVSTEEGFDVNETDCKAYFEYVEDSPGYVRICLPSTKEADETFVLDERSGKYYLSGTKYTDMMFTALSKIIAVEKQGPAISLVDDIPSGSVFHVKGGISKDLVLALPCYPWPTVAEAWEARVRKSHWIPAHVVETIIKDGCHVVGVPSKQSESPDLEWRLSFSASEGKLAREAVTDYQRQCFIYIKILHHQKIKPMGILSSYVFKSVFLHCCERLPVSHWKDYPGNCILYILDVVMECLKKKHVPTFFLPENNLIGHLNDADIAIVIAAVEGVRRDPISPVLEFTDNRLFPHHCVYFTFREMVEPLLTDMVDFKEHRNKEMSVMKGILVTSYRICNFLIAETSTSDGAALFKHKEGIRCLIGVYNRWLKPMNLDATLVEFVDKAGLSFHDPEWCMTFFETVVGLEDEYPEFAQLNLDVARMYHRLACSEGCTSQKKTELLAKAVLLYKRVCEGDRHQVIDYSLLLINQGRFPDAGRLLRRLIDEHDEAKTAEEINFDSKDKNRLVGHVKEYVEANGNISGDVVSFAFYFLVYCMTSSGHMYCSKDILVELENLESRRRIKENNTDSLRLLDFAKSLTKEKGDSASYFGNLFRQCSVL